LLYPPSFRTSQRKDILSELRRKTWPTTLASPNPPWLTLCLLRCALLSPGNYSVIILAIVDDRGLFRYLDIGQTGSNNDSGIFRRTGLWDRAMKEVRADDAGRRLPRRLAFPQGKHLVGDKAFALTPFLMKPYGEGQITGATASQECNMRFYNYLHSSTRFVVEHAFGRLKAKFACLQRLDCTLEYLNKRIAACCVLTNYVAVREREDLWRFAQDSALEAQSQWAAAHGAGGADRGGAGEPGAARAAAMRTQICENLQVYRPRNWGHRTESTIRRLVGGEGRQLRPQQDWVAAGAVADNSGAGGASSGPT